MTTALALAAASAGCQQRSADASLDLSTLPRDGITVAQRAQWHSQLKWADDCENAFRASHAGDAGGMRIVRLRSTVSLVEVICAAGSYQPSVIRFALADDTAGVRSVPLTFPVYATEDGRDLRLSQETEVWGESVVTPESAEISILSLSRQTADCGVWARYSLAADQPRLLAAAARVRCPDTPGAPVAISASGPPPGWDAIPRKD
jgi:hypothetical protein